MNLLKKLECKKLQKSPPKPNSKETHAQRLVSWAWTQLKSLVARTAVWGLINCYDCKVCKCWWLWNSCCEPPNLPVSAYLCLSSVSKGFFSENTPVLKLVFQLSLTWFLSCFKKTLLQCVFSSHLFFSEAPKDWSRLFDLHASHPPKCGLNRRAGDGEDVAHSLCALREGLCGSAVLYICRDSVCFLRHVTAHTQSKPNDFLHRVDDTRSHHKGPSTSDIKLILLWKTVALTKPTFHL